MTLIINSKEYCTSSLPPTPSKEPPRIEKEIQKVYINNSIFSEYFLGWEQTLYALLPILVYIIS